MNNRYYRVVKNDLEPDYVWIRNDSTETSILSVPYDHYKDVEYSYDKIEWSTFRVNNSVEIQPQQKVYLRCTDVPYYYINAAHGSSGVDENMAFKFEKECSFGGDIRTLIDYKTLPTIIPENHFDNTFYNCTLAKSLPDFTYIVVDEGFGIPDISNMNNITTPIRLPNLIAFEYSPFYRESENIKNSFDYNKILKGEFKNWKLIQDDFEFNPMLSQNSILTGTFDGLDISIPKELPKRFAILNDVGYMYANCANLTKVMNLSNIRKIDYADYMYSNCTSLTEVSDNNNVNEINDCQYMYSGCTNLKTGMDLSKVKVIKKPMYSWITNGFCNMYNNCSKLEEIIAPNISVWDTNKFTNWVKGVAANGTFYKPKGLEIPTGNNGIPTGWVVKEY